MIKLPQKNKQKKQKYKNSFEKLYIKDRVINQSLKMFTGPNPSMLPKPPNDL